MCKTHGLKEKDIDSAQLLDHKKVFICLNWFINIFTSDWKTRNRRLIAQDNVDQLYEQFRFLLNRRNNSLYPKFRWVKLFCWVV